MAQAKNALIDWMATTTLASVKVRNESAPRIGLPDSRNGALAAHYGTSIVPVFDTSGSYVTAIVRVQDLIAAPMMSGTSFDEFLVPVRSVAPQTPLYVLVELLQDGPLVLLDSRLNPDQLVWTAEVIAGTQTVDSRQAA